MRGLLVFLGFIGLSGFRKKHTRHTHFWRSHEKQKVTSIDELESFWGTIRLALDLSFPFIVLMIYWQSYRLSSIAYR